MQEDEEQIEYQDEYPIANEAIVRIEKAKLYQLLLQNDLFGEDAGDWQAIEQVTDEIKAFVLGQLETLIGMRSGNEAIVTQARLPWDAKQIQALTVIADTLIAKDIRPLVPTPPKPSVKTIGKPAAPTYIPPRQKAPAPVAAPKPQPEKPKPRPTAPRQGTKPIIGSNKPTTAALAPTVVKPGDERAYSKPIDNPKRKAMPAAAEMHMLAMAQVQNGADFVSQGSGTPEDSQAVGRLLLRGMSAQIESVQQGVD